MRIKLPDRALCQQSLQEGIALAERDLFQESFELLAEELSPLRLLLIGKVFLHHSKPVGRLDNAGFESLSHHSLPSQGPDGILATVLPGLRSNM